MAAPAMVVGPVMMTAVMVVGVCVVHGVDGIHPMRATHTILPMAQKLPESPAPTDDLDDIVRQRIRGLRMARGWTLDALASRAGMSPSTVSRIETGHRRVALDQLVAIAHALDTTLDQLVEPIDDADIVIRPEPHAVEGITIWPLSRDGAPQGVSIAKMRFNGERTEPVELRVHPGREWFTVISGTVELRLGERVILVPAGQAAEFNTMIPHAIGARGGPVEVLSIFDLEGRKAHLRGSAPGLTSRE